MAEHAYYSQKTYLNNLTLLVKLAIPQATYIIRQRLYGALSHPKGAGAGGPSSIRRRRLSVVLLSPT